MFWFQLIAWYPYLFDYCSWRCFSPLLRETERPVTFHGWQVDVSRFFSLHTRSEILSNSPSNNDVLMGYQLNPWAVYCNGLTVSLSIPVTGIMVLITGMRKIEGIRLIPIISMLTPIYCPHNWYACYETPQILMRSITPSLPDVTCSCKNRWGYAIPGFSTSHGLFSGFFQDGH